ncbi:MAG: hypothetical protein AABY15_01735 [Nanoarchaeota archaeon]
MILKVYKQRMKEGWQGKLFGIILPIFATITIGGAFLIEDATILIPLQMIASLLFTISYILLYRFDNRILERKIIAKIWGSIDDYERITGNRLKSLNSI